MRRFHEEAGLMRQRLKIHRRETHETRYALARGYSECVHDHLGKYRKRRPLACSKRDCIVCQWSKIYCVARRKDKILRDRIQEQLAA